MVLSIVVVVILAGTGIRLIGITGAPIDYHPTRQYNSALLARKYYVAIGGEVPGVGAETVRAAAPKEIEPPIMEWSSVLVWRLLGHEALWVPRVLSILLWALATWWLFLLARRLSSDRSAVVAVVVMQLLPFAIAATRVFQPDPLMVAATVGALLAVVADDDVRDRRSFAIAAVATGLAIFAKAPAVFFTVPVYLALAGRRWFGACPRTVHEGRRALRFLVAASLPALLYTVIGFEVFGFLSGQEGGRFLPSLWSTVDFWDSWSQILQALFGFTLVVAVAAVVLVRGRPRWVLAMLLAAYVVYGLSFPHHIGSHSYYSLPLVPVVALGTGLTADRLLAWTDARHRDLLSVGVVVLVLGLPASQMVIEDATNPPPTVTAAQGRMVAASTAAGEAAGHSAHTLFVAPDSGNELLYYGGVAGEAWPTDFDVELEQREGLAPETVEHRLARMRARVDAEYFLVTDLAQWRSLTELRALVERQPLLASGDGYLVFALRTP